MGLREAILAGEYRTGEKLVEADLAQQFGTSRGPIREAVRELVREGLVIEYPHRGNVVKRPTVRDVDEVYGVRVALDIAAAEHVIADASDEAIAALGAHLDAIDEAGDYLSGVPHDLGFHRGLIALTGNGRMLDLYEQMLGQTTHLLHAAASANPTLRSTMEPAAHRDILAALTARDATAARETIRAHYRYAQERLRPALEWFDSGFGS